MYYDKVSNYFISNQLFYETIDDNYNIIKITNLESRSIVILNFNIYNKEKKIIYDNSININNLESYNIKNPIIYASLIIVDSESNESKEYDITYDIDKYILNNVVVNLNDTKNIWISFIKNTYNYIHNTNNVITYKIITDDVSIYAGNNIEIVIKNNNVTFIT
jgi:hypothetical protein